MYGYIVWEMNRSTSEPPSGVGAKTGPAGHASAPPSAWPAGIDGLALFIDVDGSLLEFRPTPAAVFAPLDVRRLIVHLQRALDGALAVLSGRTLNDLDRIFHPLRLPGAGIHGIQRRAVDGRLHQQPVDRRVLDAARPELERFVAMHPGALLEDKGHALALHTRRLPQAGPAAAELVARLAAASNGAFRSLPGKHVAELRPAVADKGDALAAFMAEPPFAGRRPLMIGDDLTDADAFREVRARGGLAIAVGDDAPEADLRLASPADCRAWLARASRFQAPGPTA